MVMLSVGGGLQPWRGERRDGISWFFELWVIGWGMGCNVRLGWFSLVV